MENEKYFQKNEENCKNNKKSTRVTGTDVRTNSTPARQVQSAK